MAREEQDREDLLREASALVERAEVALADGATRVVLGFRRDGCASFYFGSERAYQFNTDDALRRAPPGRDVVQSGWGAVGVAGAGP